MYSLTLDTDNRILSATYPNYNPNGLIVEELPQGNICDYIVVITEATEETEQSIEYVYSPLPAETAAQTPTQLDAIEAQVLYTALMTDTLV